MARKPRVLSLYSGAGGLDYGFEEAGFMTTAALEMDHDACNTLRLNRKRWAVLEENIHDVSTETLLEAAKLKPGEADVLIGGPPCQPFSKSGYWASGDTKRLADPRSTTLGAYMRVVEEALPRVFLLENVGAMSYSGKSEGVELLGRLIDDINAEQKVNYVPYCRVLRAADFGVPQLRDRFFLVAAREGTKFKFPDPTHRPPDRRGEQLSFGRDSRPQYHTAWDALHDIIPDQTEDLRVRGKWAELLPSVPEGENYLWHTDRGGGEPLFGWRRRFWNFLLKLAKDRPSWTVQAQPGPATGPFHWENRRLSRRELCRIQTFPDSVHITGSLGAVQRQLGNAVPSLLGEVLAREIWVQLLGRGKKRKRPNLLLPTQLPPPPPETPGPVPPKYLKLRGEHDAHPGTGQGYRASQVRSDQAR